MGAVVQILGAANLTLTVFTDDAGHYTATGLLPGVYTMKVTAPSFLPALREKIGLRPGASLNVNITLGTLLGAMQLGPVRTGPSCMAPSRVPNVMLTFRLAPGRSPIFSRSAGRNDGAVTFSV